MSGTLFRKIGRTMSSAPDRISGLFLAAVAVVALISAADLPFGTIGAPDAGFFPRSLSALLLIFGLGLYLRPSEMSRIEAPSGRVAISVVALCVYAIIVPFVGFVISTILMMLLLMCGFGGMTWKQASLTAIPGVLIAYIGFVELGVPLPRGILPY